MKRDEKPILLTVYGLKKPIITTKNKLDEIFNELQKNELSEIIIQGLFALGISSFEIMISEVMTYFLNCIPQKLENRDVKISKEELLNEDFISLFIEKTIISLLYKPLNEVLDTFLTYYQSSFYLKMNISINLLK